MWSHTPDMNTSQAGGFFDESQVEDQDKGQTKQRAKNIVPVTIGYLLNTSSAENMNLYNIPVRVVNALGVIRSIEETPTKISYTIEDYTGTITAMKWLDAKENHNASDPPVAINTYVHIIGVLRDSNGKRHLFILRMWPLENLNALTNHGLETMYAVMQAEAISKKVDESEPSTTHDATSTYYDADSNGMSTEQITVYKIIQAKNDTEAGIERSEIKEKLPKALVPNAEKILEFLISEGHIYTTRTDDHFKTT